MIGEAWALVVLVVAMAIALYKTLTDDGYDNDKWDGDW